MYWVQKQVEFRTRGHQDQKSSAGRRQQKVSSRGRGRLVEGRLAVTAPMGKLPGPTVRMEYRSP